MEYASFSSGATAHVTNRIMIMSSTHSMWHWCNELKLRLCCLPTTAGYELASPLFRAIVNRTYARRGCYFVSWSSTTEWEIYKTLTVYPPLKWRIVILYSVTLTW